MRSCNLYLIRVPQREREWKCSQKDNGCELSRFMKTRNLQTQDAQHNPNEIIKMKPTPRTLWCNCITLVGHQRKKRLPRTEQQTSPKQQWEPERIH